VRIFSKALILMMLRLIWSFASGSFDAIITNAAADARLLNQECHRLLKGTHGVMVVITHGNPESRLIFFENPDDEWWSDVGIHTILEVTQRSTSLDGKQG
jgi:hypothetical protein